MVDEVVKLVTPSASVADDVVKAAVDSGKTTTGTKPPLKMDLQYFADKGDDVAKDVGNYLATKAPNQVTAGTRVLQGQYVDDLGRVQPWVAHYDEYGRLVGRTDYNAGNIAQDIPNSYYHTYEWGLGKSLFESGSHIQGEYIP
ncbi:hypothetical protein IW492_14175 [Enterococcus sp. BWB1-3]|uniref:hypothetical protein n=1 Tax=Enterococcus sp. BWB1-3 TaxID=2787713 RepID=UPI001921E9C4|nr:hypothetical protein [Enterococcus sp. BWB1-3]MBL1230379.1 hypothetical protein [Enterococcus sp. BWB1-3]